MQLIICVYTYLWLDLQKFGTMPLTNIFSIKHYKTWHKNMFYKKTKSVLIETITGLWQPLSIKTVYHLVSYHTKSLNILFYIYFLIHSLDMSVNSFISYECLFPHGLNTYFLMISAIVLSFSQTSIIFWHKVVYEWIYHFILSTIVLVPAP